MTDFTADQLLEMADKANKVGNVDAAKHFFGEYQKAANAPAGIGIYPRAKSNAKAEDNSFPNPAQLAGEVAKQATSVIGLPIEALRFLGDKLGGDETHFGELTGKVHKAIDSVIAPPETKGGQALTRVAGGTLAGAAVPGNLVRNLITGLASTVGGAAGSEVGGNLADDKGRVIGGLLGAFAGGAPLSLAKGQGNTKEMLAEALKGVKPAEIEAAKRQMSEAVAMGVRLTPDQLFAQGTGLSALLNKILGSGAGDGKLQELVRSQPDSAMALVSALANRLGANPRAAVAARDLRLALEGVIGNVKPPASNARNFGFGESRIGGGELQQIDEHLGTLANAYKGNRDTLAQIEQMRADLQRVSDTQKFTFGNKSVLDTEPGLKSAKRLMKSVPNEMEVNLGANPADLDMVVKRIKANLDDIKISTPGLSRLQTGQVSDATKSITNLLDQLAPTRFAGRDIHSSAMGRGEDIRASLTGRIVGVNGVNEAKPDPMNVLNLLLPAKGDQSAEISALSASLRERAAREGRGVAPALEAEQQATARFNGITDPAELAAANKAGQRAESAGTNAAQANRALPQAGRVLFEQAIDNTFGRNGMSTPANAGQSFSSAVLGGPGSSQEKNFTALMRGIGSSVGENPQEFSQGMVNAIRVLEASGRNRSGAALGEALATRGGDISSRILNSPAVVGGIASGNPVIAGAVAVGKGLSAKFENMMYERQYRKLAEVFSNPDAIRIIVEMGKTPLMSSRQGAWLTTLFSTLQQPTNQPLKDRNVP